MFFKKIFREMLFNEYKDAFVEKILVEIKWE